MAGRHHGGRSAPPPTPPRGRPRGKWPILRPGRRPAAGREVTECSILLHRPPGFWRLGRRRGILPAGGYAFGPSPPEGATMLARDVMTTTVTTVSPDTPV